MSYLGSVMATQRHLADMVDAFRASDEPIVLVVFGDHKPWLGNGNSVYHALGVNLDQDSQEGFYNYWSTPYLIWANDAAKAAVGRDTATSGRASTSSSTARSSTPSSPASRRAWDRPAYACLATRIPAGEEITREKLQKTEAAESLLFSLGFSDFRVRLLGGRAPTARSSPPSSPASRRASSHSKAGWKGERAQ